MTREEAKELLPIIQAFAEGKTIQFKTKDRPWFDLLDNNLEMREVFKYRIKPEPKYRPFKSQEECWNEMLKHQPFGWIKDDYKYIHISSVFKDEIECSPDEVNGTLFTYNKKKKKKYEGEGYTFADGTPFGIREE